MKNILQIFLHNPVIILKYLRCIMAHCHSSNTNIIVKFKIVM